MAFTPLALVDEFLVNYHFGQVLVLLFVLSVVGTVPIGSRKIISINALLFGVLFLLTPASLMAGGGLDAFPYRFLGVALVVIAPMLYVTSRE